MLKKKVECIMLDTTDTNPVNVPFLKLVQKTNQGERLKNHIVGGEFRRYLSYGCIPQHLYFVDDSPIKEGKYNWVFNSSTKRIYKINPVDKKCENEKVIIATTDKSLKIKNDCDCGAATFEGCSQCLYNLPQPSDSFIASYIKAFNEGNPIKYVMVDWEEKGYWMNLESHSMAVKPEWINTHDELKVDKNNTITITRCKESWSRQEIIQFMDDWYDKDIFDSYLNELIDKDLSGESLSFSKSDVGKKWIEQNL